MNTLKDKIFEQIKKTFEEDTVNYREIVEQLHSLLLEEVSKAIKNERLYQNGVSNISSEQYIEQLNK